MSLVLTRDEVHVWYVRCHDPEEIALLERYASVLSPSEQERRRRFVFPRDRELFLMAHVLLRLTLSRYAEVAPEAWGFERASLLTKPQIASPPGFGPLRFNLSHTAGLVACAIAKDDEIGLDVEKVDRTVDLSVARACFSEVELAHLMRLAGEEQQEIFFQYWTLKEAYAKARGDGLSLPLAQLSFSLLPGQPPEVSFAPAFDDEPDNWQFFQDRPIPQHYLAVAVQRSATPRSNFVVRSARSLFEENRD